MRPKTMPSSPCRWHAPLPLSLATLSLAIMSLAVMSLAVIATSCDRHAAPAGTVARAALAGPKPLFLIAPGAHALAATDSPCAILLGNELANPGQSLAGTRWDPCCARVGGAQENELVAQQTEGAWTLPVRFPEAGDGVVGFTVHTSASAGAQPARLRQHAKCVVPVVTGGPEPVGSPGAFARRLGLDVEIVPMVDPTRLRPGEELPLRIRSNHGGANNVEVTVAIRPDVATGPARELLRAKTDSDGNLIVRLSETGLHLISTQVVDSAGTTHLSTLTFRNGGAR